MRKLNIVASWAVAGVLWLIAPLAGANADPDQQSPAAADVLAPVLADAAISSEAPAVSAAKQAYVKSREARKRERSTRNRADRPHDSVAFYVNKRTGPILTRGPNKTTGMRGLDPGKYLAALAKARQADARAQASRTGRIGLRGAASPGATLGTWEALGPNNQGGRTRQLLIDPRSPDTMYAAAVGGGVWKSINGGLDWIQLTDLLLPNIAVASLAMDPNNSQVLYAGTGEGFFNGDAIRGAGIFKTTDGGTTWSPLAATTPAAGLLGDFSYVTQIVVSPRASQRVYATTRNGLYRSNDGGATWARLIDANAVLGCQDVTMQLKRAVGYVFAACGTFAQANVYRALDSPGSTFSAVFSVPNMGRTSLAIAPSNEAVIYAMSAANAGAYGDGLLGVFRSTANGNLGSWTTQVSNTDPNKINTLLLSNPVYGLGQCFGLNSLFNQGWYDNVIAVDPLDSNRVWAGGIDLFRSDDGGKNWGVASYWWFDKGIDLQYAHADQHVIRFHPGYNGTTNKKMFVASDGGIFRTDDARAAVGKTAAAVCGNPVPGAVTWTELNNNYNTTQFYHGAVYPDGNTYFGGLQDNGTKRGSVGSLGWTTLQGGDGGYNAVDTGGDADPANDVLFAEYTGLSIQKSVDGGLTFFDAVTGISDNGFDFIAPFHMNAGNRQQLWTGGWFLWRTTNQAASWEQASDVTPGAGSVSAVAVSPQNPNRVVAAMSDGYLLSNISALAANFSTGFSPGDDWKVSHPRNAFVTSVAFDPSNDSVVYATYATFSGTSLYKSSDAGVTWAPLVGSGATALPQVPALTVVVDPSSSQRIYVGTDIGVYTTLDGGLTWYREVTGFGNVSVEHLEINSEGTRRLYAFTHGRGAWRVAINP